MAKHGLNEPVGWFRIYFRYFGWVAMISGVFLLVMTAASYFTYKNAMKYEQVGVTAPALVTARRRVRDDDAYDYYLTFQFVAGPTVVTSEEKVGSSLYRDGQVGTRLEIRYLPDNPWKFETYVGQKRNTARTLQFVALFTGIGSLSVLWFAGRAANSAILARRLGRKVRARVVGHKEHKNKGKRSGRGRLLWSEPDGATGKSLAGSLNRLERWKRGDIITVYRRKNKSYWEGDVGPRAYDKSSIPAVEDE